MLVPAIARKAELEQLFAEHIYDDDMFLYNGYPLKKVVKDTHGRYHNEYIYEIVRDGVENEP